MKKENLGKICFLKTIKLVKTSNHDNFPIEEDYLPFTIVELTKNGYLIQEHFNKNIFKVKTKDIDFKDEKKEL